MPEDLNEEVLEEEPEVEEIPSGLTCPLCGGKVALSSTCMYCTVCEWSPC